MWTCALCGQSFVNTNQVHSCNDKTLEDFLLNKSPHTIGLYHHFIREYETLGPFRVHPAKSMIGLAQRVRFCSVIRLGKNFIDVVFHFDRPYEDNLCFHKIAQVPGTSQFNHHCRIFHEDDVNAELKQFMKKALERGSKEK